MGKDKVAEYLHKKYTAVEEAVARVRLDLPLPS